MDTKSWSDCRKEHNHLIPTLQTSVCFCDEQSLCKLATIQFSLFGIMLSPRILECFNFLVRKNLKPEFETFFDLLALTYSPTTPPSEMTTKAKNGRGEGRPAASRGNRKTEGAAENFV